MATAKSIIIGKRILTSYSDFFEGNIDDVRIYNKALTSSEIAYIYNSGSGTESAIFDDNATATEPGWAGSVEGYASMHKKIRRVMKSNIVNITVLSPDSRALKILGFVVYYKLLPLIA